jgi:primosomal protein N' (replication factor Y)
VRIARVALDVPVPTLFDYRAGDAGPGDIGRRAVVPFGRRSALGVIVELAHASALAPERLKTIVRVLREEPGIAEPDLRLLRFAADYYQHPPGAVVMSALPAALKRTRRRQAFARPRVYALTAAGEAALAGLGARASAQRRVLNALREGALERAALQARTRASSRLLEVLVERGWIRAAEPAQASTPEAPAASPAPELTEEQAKAVEEICASLGTFRAYLLHGITGSGKTEVYLRAIAAAIAAGGQALLLVPEIALTPQLEATVRSRFPGVPVASLHSGLGESERCSNWLAAHCGRARVILGTRLAVFAPAPELALIVVDEEHDPSFKQPEGFRYSARDLAVARARQRGVPVVLGSATPSLESYYNASTGRYRLLRLTRRIGAPPPRIECVDTRGERLAEGLSAALLAAVEECLARGEQALIFLNRRGYAPVLACRACGWTSGCHRCAAKLVLHLKERRLRCHHCGHQSAVPASCPGCGNVQLAPLGAGTQRIESALAQRLPAARIARIDRDSIRRRDAWPQMRARIERREVDLLVGTQLLAKGHDFPHLHLVGVVNADSRLYSTDFRAAERLYALLTQVAGRAGRGSTQGRVLVQTDFPDHPLYRALVRQDYAAFAQALLAERKAAGLPPFVHQALLRAEAPRLATALDFLEQAARAARSIGPEVTIYDPVPAAMARRAGHERAQLLVQSESRRALQRFLAAWSQRLYTGRSGPVRWSLDVDPLEF